MVSNTFRILFVVLFVAVGNADPDTVDKPSIVFVCEHGSAKSVVAAAYFNHLAQQQGLPFRAVSRGTVPDPDLAPAAVNGLRADGIPLPSGKPVKLTLADASTAHRLVTFCDLPEGMGGRNVERWVAPPISEDYPKARDAIIQSIQKLILSLGKPQS